MSYESPVIVSTETIFEDYWLRTMDSIIEQTKKRFENEISNHITLQTGIKINRDELIKALEYDRNQYEKGYADGQKDAVRHGHCIDKTIQIGIPKYHYIYCSECESGYNIACVHLLIGDGKLFDRCPNCGAKMDGKEDQ